MERARLGTWLHDDWETAPTINPPEDELGQIRRATQLGEPLGSDGLSANWSSLRDDGSAPGPGGRPVGKGLGRRLRRSVDS
jgi:hypothetical protein